jgi:hypothetical protein
MSYYNHALLEDPDVQNEILEQHRTRLYALRPHMVQRAFSLSRARFNVVPAGRRSGKTEIAKRKLVRSSVAPYKLGGSRFPDPKYFCGAPTRDQAKRIFWNDIKLMTRELKLWRRDPSESQLICFLWPNVEIHIIGLDKPERIEGHPWDGGILDEYGNMKKEAWPENIRPALADRQGWCDLIGVPEGRNHYYQEWLKAKADEVGYRAGYHWKSADILSAKEISDAQSDMDPLTYEQEFEGSFVNFTGMVYYQFREELHYSKCRDNYNPDDPLIFTFDFNVSPGTAAILQEQTDWPSHLDDIENDTITSAIGEVWIPRGSNTEIVCKRLIKDWGNHRGHVFCYGDSTGGAKGTAKVRGSDWDLIKQHLYPQFGNRLHFKVKKSNPRERQRVNSVNSRLCSISGDTHFQVDARHCEHIIQDFEGTRVLDGSAGEIDKDSDPELTHLSDGIGYYVHNEYPVIKMVRPTEKHWK